ncbi:MAG: transposase [Conexivisphaerales archaeon]
MKKEMPKGAVGIDMGIRSFITTSGGLKIEPLNALRKKEKMLKRQQRKLSRKRKGSMNRKQVVKMQGIYQQVRDARTDFNHNVR